MDPQFQGYSPRGREAGAAVPDDGGREAGGAVLDDGSYGRSCLQKGPGNREDKIRGVAITTKDPPL